jgi:hypothetical protein
MGISKVEQQKKMVKEAEMLITVTKQQGSLLAMTIQR